MVADSRTASRDNASNLLLSAAVGWKDRSVGNEEIKGKGAKKGCSKLYQAMVGSVRKLTPARNAVPKVR